MNSLIQHFEAENFHQCSIQLTPFSIHMTKTSFTHVFFTQLMQSLTEVTWVNGQYFPNPEL